MNAQLQFEHAHLNSSAVWLIGVADRNARFVRFMDINKRFKEE